MKRYGEKFYFESAFSTRSVVYSSRESYLEEDSLKVQSEFQPWDIFLSHSSKDKMIVINFKNKLNAMGFSVYIDWIEDSDSKRHEIADKLKTAMNNSKVLIYLHTHNSRSSIWTPWEIGYYDSKKGTNRLGIVPLLDVNNRISTYSGQEYLLQYTEVGADVLSTFIKNGSL
ncbi:MAG TPA: toll/interleukin-1 receptor domain-containing protein [Spirochaetota bacterium]|nr:toll/interleukin-1 receptor domain-containing protein [Spirochaetota bacterium]HOR44923.1 toll/interleukin-1 receptor domain-containing protein [Spirochaetota bacterium]HPK56478.1 toll/interleukin-1 receptor domain-containing protein [Spirochaetota bacterium]